MLVVGTHAAYTATLRLLGLMSSHGIGVPIFFIGGSCYSGHRLSPPLPAPAVVEPPAVASRRIVPTYTVTVLLALPGIPLLASPTQAHLGRAVPQPHCRY